MFNFIVSKVIPKDASRSDARIREKYGLICSILSIICNAFLVVFKLIFGFITQSVAIQADGLNNLSDMGSNLATMFGFKLAGRHADLDHPYGHGRYEYIAGLIIAFIILMVGFSSLKESVVRIFKPEAVLFQWSAVIVLILSILVKIWMYMYNKSAGKTIDSSSLKAAAQDSMNDVLTTSATLISLCLSLVTDLPVDGIMGTLVSLFVLKSGVDIFKDTVNPLLGQAPSKELVDEIHQFVMSYDKVIGIHDFMMHDYGPGRLYMTLHAEVDCHEDISEVHDQIDLIERDILKTYNILTTIHMDPINTNDPLTKKLREQVIQVIKSIDERYSIHDFRIVDGPTHTNLIFDVLIPACDTCDHQIIKDKISKLMLECDKNYFCVIHVEHGFV